MDVVLGAWVVFDVKIVLLEGRQQAHLASRQLGMVQDVLEGRMIGLDPELVAASQVIFAMFHDISHAEQLVVMYCIFFRHHAVFWRGRR